MQPWQGRQSLPDRCDSERCDLWLRPGVAAAVGSDDSLCPAAAAQVLPASARRIDAGGTCHAQISGQVSSERPPALFLFFCI